MINKIGRVISKLLEIAVVVMLGIMAFLVFLNVVLRYGFNTSLMITEELSRYLFVWVTFLAAVLAFNDNSHVSVSVLIDKLSMNKKKILLICTDGVMLYCCYLIFLGSYEQMQLNMGNYAPISGIPIGINFLAGVIMSGFIGLLLIFRLLSSLNQMLRGNVQ